MKKNDIIFLICGIVLLIGSITFVIYRVFFADIWSKNADKLNKNLCKLNVEKGETVYVGDIKDEIPFEWDTLYTFKPDVSIEKIYEIVGYKWDKITKATNKGMNQLVFLKDGQVVCYVYGFPRARKVFFDFGEYEGEYFTLTSEDSLEMNMNMNKKGIRTFEYIVPKDEENNS